MTTPRRKLYSPAGARWEPSGSGKRASCSSWCSRTACLESRVWGSVSGPTPDRTSAARRSAWSRDTHENSRARNCRMLVAFVLVSRRLTSSRSTDAGWCLTSVGGAGMASVRRAKRSANDPRPPSPAKEKVNWA